MSAKSFPISKYLASVRRLITEQIPAIWVHGVITQMTLRDRVCYLTLSEFTEGEVRAQATISLILFAKELEALQIKLSELGNPFQLSEQLKVSLLLQADFHIPQGKFQAKILDIDPNYTMGELALTKKMILQRLEKEGLLKKNALLKLPLLPLHIGLITAPDSAAYHDFVETLQQSGYAFKVYPIWAKMQGNETENTVLQAIGALRLQTNLDALCIIRGGGSRTELNAFDSEALCRAVAQCNIPVFTGIGHEIDKSLLDLVSWRACITPTDTAKYLIGKVEQAEQSLNSAISRIMQNSVRRIDREKQSIRAISKSIMNSVPRKIRQEQERLERNKQGLRLGLHKILVMANLRLEPIPKRLSQSILIKMQKHHSDLEILQTKILAHDPKRILEKGYSMTTLSNGKLIRNQNELVQGEVLHTKFPWGTVRSQVI